MEITLEGKRALVTGGNSGIGAAIVKALAAAGAKVAINYIANPEQAQDMVNEIEKKNGRAMAIKTDVSDAGAVNEMFNKVDREWGGIDILVNSAGIDGKQAKTWDIDESDWRKVIEVNLLGAFLCARQSLKRMVAQKSGVILNISSVHEIIPWSGYSAYTASKAGLGMMTKTLAQEAAPHGVRVLAVGPGAVKTQINQNVWSNDKKLQDLLDKIPVNRVGEPEDIARMVVVLVSGTASYITGRTIFIDGGMTDYPDFGHGG
jgi:glucose 1-dehydrogenase